MDGALNKSGWVVLDVVDGKGQDLIKPVAYGVINPKSSLPLSYKLVNIREELINLFRKYRPTVFVFEDTYAGQNKLTTARLNNAKGVFMATAHELLDKEPVYVGAGTARKCLGFKNNKEEPFKYFQEMYNLTESFKQGNDITDAFTLGHWYVVWSREGCIEKKKKRKRVKPKKR